MNTFGTSFYKALQWAGCPSVTLDWSNLEEQGHVSFVDL
jgi:hypothetical protein